MLGLRVGVPGAGLLVAGVAFAWAGTLAFVLFLFFLPMLGGWLPPVAAGVPSSASVPSSDLRFLRFFVSGKNPFFFRFLLMGLWVALGTSLAPFFSNLGRLKGREQGKKVPSEGSSHRCLHLGPVGPQRPTAPASEHALEHGHVQQRAGVPSPRPGVRPPPRTYWTPRVFMACQ